MANYLKHVYRKIVPRSEPISGREHEMALNSNAGYVFPANDWTRLERFLILGSEGGSFYASERALTVESAQAVKRSITDDGRRVVKTIVEISDGGRAPKNDPALFALAMAASFGNDQTRGAALDALPRVASVRTCSTSQRTWMGCAAGAAVSGRPSRTGTSPSRWRTLPTGQ